MIFLLKRLKSTCTLWLLCMGLSLSSSNTMKNQNNINHFLTRGGRFYPVAPNHPILKSWEPKDRLTHEVLGVKIYAKDLHVSDNNKRTPRKVNTRKITAKRGVIKKYSFLASRRLRFVMRNIAHLMQVIITLTYPLDYPMDGALVKKHLHRFLSWLRQRGYRNVWILEFQERGAPHFHILVDNKIDHKEVAQKWYAIVASGDEKHLRAGTETRAIKSKGGIAHYMTSYLNKAKQKAVPEEYQKVGRFWGCSKGLLQKDEFRLYGNIEDIAIAKEKLKIARQFDRGQKKQWERKAKAKSGKKNKFKKFYNPFQEGAYSLKVTNSDKLLAELESRNLDTFPFSLLSIPPVPPLPHLAVRGNGGKNSDEEHDPRQSLGLSL